jgi:hypothetical protein
MAGLFAQTTFAQAKGNYDYRELSNINFVHSVQQPHMAALAMLPQPGVVEFRIRGLTNCTADSYLAIFTLTQVGKSQREADELMGAKIDSVRARLKAAGAEAELFVDMISFLPMYETDAIKKLFSKTTYNEIPVGFELKKNLHFRYSDPSALEQLVTICAQSEIYDLVRVDYFIDDMEKKKAEMMAKGEAMLKARIERHKVLMNEDFDDKDRQLAEGFAVYYPIEQYRTYTTYHSTTLNKMGGETKAEQMTKAQFFLPRMSKEYDFVYNNTILEPVIQIEYELVMRMTPKPKQPEKPTIVEKTEKQYILISPDGQVKALPL